MSARSTAVIAFIENLIIPSGEGEGTNFKLRDWQKAFLRDVYDPIKPDGRRKVRHAVLSLGRKNGKTALAAALVLVHLIGPEAVRNGELYSAANDQKQAAIVFKYVCQLIEADPELSLYLDITKSQRNILCRHNGSTYNAISAEAYTKDGLNSTFVIYDELSRAPTEDLYDVLATSFGARAEPLMLIISTQARDPQAILSRLIKDGLESDDESKVCHLYAAKDDAPINDEASWRAANPALGDFLQFDYVRDLAAEASRMPGKEAAFRNFILNQNVSLTESIVTRADWQACEQKGLEFIDREPLYLGIDLSTKTDLTALVAVSADNGTRVKAWAWKPKDSLVEHADRDRFQYPEHVRNGWLQTTPGRSVDPMAVALRVAQFIKDGHPIKGVAYDRWHIDELLRCFDAIGLNAQEGEGRGLRVVPWGQGFRDMAPAVDAFESAVLQEEITHDGNPVLTWCVMNTQVKTDPAGNRKLDKGKSRFRIDACVAMCMALGLKAQDRQKPKPTDPWAKNKDYKTPIF